MARVSRTEAWESKVPDTLEPPSGGGRPPMPPPQRREAKLHAIGSDIASYTCTIGFGALAKVVKILIDSGASHSFLSTQLAEQLEAYRTPRRATQLDVEVANGETLQTKGYLQLPIAFGEWKARVGIHALNLPYHDMILGRDWLKKVNPQIDWTTSEMRFPGKDGRYLHAIRPIDIRNHVSSVESSLELMSAKQAARTLKKQGKEAFLAVIRPLQEANATREEKVDAIVKEFAAVFREELPPTLTPERGLKHRIDTADEPPVNQPFYPLSQEKLEELKRQLTELLNKGIIRVSFSPCFPVVFAPKGNGKWRMCIDYRLLNQKTLRNGYPLPRIQDLIDQVGGAKYLSKIDPLSGYWQVKMDEASIHKTAFNTLFGKYEFLAMPFGLSNAPATFQTLMNRVLAPYLENFCFVYLDDILIFSETWEEHERHIKTVLETLQQNELFVKGSKCVFGVEELEFCGHIVGQGTVRPVPDKLEVIKEWPQPRNVHELRQIIGLSTYYCRFVRDFAKIAAPLHELLKEKDAGERKRRYRSVLWNPGCEKAFQQLKTALVTAPVLAIVNPKERFRIETDASEWAIGMVLSQPVEDGKWHPVAFDGRKLNGAERNYPTQEKELLAIKEALRCWEYHLENGTTTEVLTDHESLKYLATTRTYSKRLVRWVEVSRLLSMAISDRFVMSSLLTLSASHLAWTTCDVNMSQLVLHHRVIALRGLQEVVRGSSPGKCEAILAASMLLSWQDSEWSSWASIRRGMDSVLLSMPLQLKQGSELAKYLEYQKNLNLEILNSHLASNYHFRDPVNIVPHIEAVQSIQKQGHYNQVSELLQFLLDLHGDMLSVSFTAEEAFDRVQPLRLWLLWLPAAILRGDDSDTLGLAILARLLTNAADLDYLFAELGDSDSGLLSVGPIGIYQTIYTRSAAAPSSPDIAALCRVRMKLASIDLKTGVYCDPWQRVLRRASASCALLRQ